MGDADVGERKEEASRGWCKEKASAVALFRSVEEDAELLLDAADDVDCDKSFAT